MNLVEFISYIVAGMSAGIGYSVWTGKRFDYLRDKRRMIAPAIVSLGVIIAILIQLLFTSA